MLSTEREIALKHLCDNGVNHDNYDVAIEIIDTMMIESSLTKHQRRLMESLLSSIGDYEEKYYPMGN